MILFGWCMIAAALAVLSFYTVKVMLFLVEQVLYNQVHQSVIISDINPSSWDIYEEKGEGEIAKREENKNDVIQYK